MAAADAAEVVEELVESYMYALEQVYNDVKQVLSSIAATQDFVNVNLDKVGAGAGV